MTVTQMRGSLVPPLDPDTVAGRGRKGEPAHRRIIRAVRRVFDASQAEVHELADLLSAVQQPLPTGRRIAVTGVRGGCGKTTVAALLGRVYARRRADRVLTLDADPEAGSLSWRLGLQAGHSVTVLAKAVQAGKVKTMADLQPLLAGAGDGLWCAPAPVHPEAAVATVATARDVSRALSRYFGVSVLDCGHGLTIPTPVLLEAHCIVMAAPATIDGLRSTRAALDRRGLDLERVVVVLTSLNDRTEGVDLRQATRAMEVLGVPVVRLGYDRHLAAGGVLDVARLGEPTVLSATRLAAWALRRARPL